MHVRIKCFINFVIFTTEGRRIYRERGDKLENVRKCLPQREGGNIDGWSNRREYRVIVMNSLCPLCVLSVLCVKKLHHRGRRKLRGLRVIVMNSFCPLCQKVYHRVKEESQSSLSDFINCLY